MKTKLLTVIIGCMLLMLFGISQSFGQRGITNNGARIVVTSGGIINITGGTNADYTNKSGGGTDGRIDLDGTIKLEGDWINNATAGEVLVNVDTDGEVQLNGSTSQVIGGSGSTQFEKLTVNNAAGVSLSANAGVNGNLTLTSGKITLGSKNLTLGTASTIVGAPSASNMVVATGTGELRKSFSAIGSFTFPVGDATSTAEYSPVTLNFSSGAFSSAYAGIRLTDAKHPSNTTTGKHVTRYWSLSQSGITSFSCNVTATYLDADIAGTGVEADMFAGYWNSPNWVKMSPANTGSNQLTGTLTAFYDITGGDMAMFCASSPAIAYSSSDVSCAGGGDGSIDLTVSGGLTPYGFNWTTIGGSGLTAGDEDQTGLTAGTYDVTVTDQNGCTGNESVVITEPLVLSSTISGVHVTCNGLSNGSIDLSPSGGTMPYGYAWSNSDNTQDISGLAAGLYGVTITDALGCQATNSFTITQPTSISTSFTSVDANCFGEANGSADLTVSGGTPAGASPFYSYSWAHGPTTEDISTLIANTYFVTVTDNNSCTVTNNITINQPANLVATITPTAVSCNGGNTGSADLTVSGGTIDYSYEWSNSATTQNITGLAAGPYSVTVTDDHTCIVVRNTTVTQPTAVTAAASGTNALCNGDNTGTASVTGSGGISPYTYYWNTNETTQNISDLLANTYNVTVYDANLCEAYDNVVIGEPAALSLTITGTNVSCNGGTNGSATISSGGGTPTNSYLWSNSSTTGNISNLVANTYTLTLTDANLCTIVDNIVITQPAAISTSISGTDASCFGYSNASADLSASGGTAPLAFEWNTTATTEDISGLVAGTYTVTVTDGNTCTADDIVVLGEPTEISLTFAENPASTCGAADGSATVTPSGGSGTYTSYLWTPAGGTGAATATYSDLLAGSYNVVVSDDSGCTNDGTANIIDGGAHTVAITASSDVTCNGGNNGEATVTVTGGTPDYTYTWSVGAPVVTSSTSNTATGLAAGTYFVTVTDAGGVCNATTSVIISQPTLLISTISGTNISCNAGNDGTATVSPSGGTSPYNYNWGSGPATATEIGLSAGTQSCTISDALGCQIIKSIILTEPDPIILSTVGTDPSCSGYSNGSVDLSVSGGTPNYSFLWSNSDNTEDISGLMTNTYGVTVTDAKGCIESTSTFLGEPATLIATIAGTEPLCFGDANGEADLTVTGGTTAYSYDWSNGATTEDLTGIVADDYTVTVTDFNGCQAISFTTIGQPAELVATLTPADVLCFNGNTGNVETTVTGGTVGMGGYGYIWNSGPTTANIYDLVAGPYQVIISDDNACSIVENTTVNEPAQLIANVSTIMPLCNGGVDGSAAASVSGGAPGYSFMWDGTYPNPIITVGAGSYNVVVTDDNGCTAENTATVAEPPALTLSIAGSNVSCNSLSDGSATITVTGGTPTYSYDWDSGQTTGDINNVPAGIYTLLVTDANSCEISDFIDITEPEILVSTISGTDAVCFDYENGSVDLEHTGGTATFTYLWNNAATTQDLPAVGAGTYNVTITDLNGCKEYNTYTVNEPAGMTTSITTTDVNCFGDTDGTADLAVTGGTLPHTYYWSTTDETQNIAAVGAGWYYVTVYDASACFVEDSVEIFEPSELLANISSTDATCFDLNNGSADLTATGGTPVYSYEWSTGETSSSIAGLLAGEYYLTVSDQLNCEYLDTVVISEPTEVILTFTETDATCFNVADGAIDLSISGGMTPYSTVWNNMETTTSITNLLAGEYIVAVTDDYSCETIDTTYILQPDEIVLQGSSVDANCGQADGEASVAILSGGVPGFTYQWDDPLNQTNATATGLFAGTYNVVVEDTDGCSSVESVTVVDADAPVATIISFTDIDCFGNCNGTATVEAVGGTTPYSYVWDGGSTPDQTTVTDLCAGTYNVSVSDYSGCITFANVTISEPDELLSTTTQSDISCFNACDGIATVVPSGGTTPYNYSWSNAETTAMIDTLCAGTFGVVITDGNACTALNSVDILEPALLEVFVGGTDITCYGEANGTTNVTISGGTMPYQTEWSTGDFSESVSQLLPDMYHVTVADQNGCEIEDSIELFEPDTLAGDITGLDIACFGDATGEVSITATGGVTPYSYEWNTADVTSTVTGLTAGFYEAILTDDNGCQIIENISISEPTLMEITYLVTDEDLGNDGEIDISVIGGVTPYGFLWGGGETTEDLTGLTSGTYYVIVTDDNGCSLEQPIQVNFAGCIMTASIIGSDLNCYGDFSGEATVNPVDGTTPYTYNWTDNQTTQTATNLAAGDYFVTVTDDIGCVVIEPISIFQPDSLEADITQMDVTCNGNANGEAHIAIQGGSAPYYVNWDGGETTESIYNLDAGTYNVNVMDDNGCTTQTSTTISQPAALGIIITPLNVDCYNGNTGEATAVVTGGTSPYIFDWDNGETSDVITNLSVGDYSCTASDQNGCEIVEVVSIGQNDEIIITGVVVDEDMGLDGAIDVSVSGGVTPYTYNWDSGQTTEDLTGISAGVYWIIVTDNVGCTAETSFPVNDISCNLIASISGNNLNCYNDFTGEATVVAINGTTPYTYNWDDPMGQNSPVATSLAAGTYTVTVEDAGNCIVIETIDIMQPDMISTMIDGYDITCFGFNDGIADLILTGGVEPYSFEWSNNETTEDISDLSSSTYEVTITDFNGCQNFAGVSITEPEELTGTIFKTDILCNGADNGFAEIAVLGGMSPYSFEWSNGSVFYSVEDLAAGYYTVTVLDNNSCEIVESTTILESDPILITGVITDEDTGNDGAVDITVSGGFTPYTFDWSTGETSEDIAGVTTGTYTVTVSDFYGCQSSEQFYVSNVSCQLVATISGTDLTCNGDNTGEAVVFADLGVEPYTYAWDDPMMQTDSNAVDLAAGTYYVTVSANDGCETVAQFTVNEPDPLGGTIDGNDISCFGMNDGELHLNTFGGTSPYNVTWNAAASGSDLYDLIPGLYEVTITDDNGCEAYSDFTISQPDLLDGFIVGTDILCNGETSGMADLTVTGGIAPYNFDWSNGLNDEDLFNLSADYYEVIVTDENGCEFMSDIVISEPDPIQATWSVIDETVADDGEIDLTVTGGVAPYTFYWSNSATSEDITGLAAGIYEVIITDDNGCEIIEQIVVSSSICDMVVTTDWIDANCSGSNDGAAAAIVSGGTTPYAFAWSNGQTNDTAFALTAGDYFVTVSDSNGCLEIAQIIVSEPEMLELNIEVFDIACNGDNNGALNLTITGGIIPVSIDWSSGDTIADLFNLSAGFYEVTVVDDNGCVAVDGAQINEAPVLEAIITSQDVLCFGGNTGMADLDVTGGIMPYTYDWSTGDNGEDLFDIMAGFYEVTVTDYNNCQSVTFIDIVQPDEISLSYTVINENVGADGEIDLEVAGGSTPFTYEWSTTETTQDIVGLTSGIYYVVVTDNNGCQSDESIVVNLLGCDLSIMATGNNATCYDSDDGAATVIITGGTTPYTTSWSDGQSTVDATGLIAGDYGVTVTDDAGCMEIADIFIDAPEMLDYIMNTQDISCFGMNDGEIHVTIIGGTLPYYDMVWGSLPDGNDHVDLAQGTYAGTIVDANGCIIDPVTATINEPELLTADLAIMDINCNGEMNGEIDLTIAGGTLPYDISWSNGETTPDLFGLTAGQYDVQVVDANGCMTNSSGTVLEPDAITITSVVTPDDGTSNGAIDITVAGGMTPYTYDWSTTETTEDISGLAANIYIVIVTDDNGCVVEEAISVNSDICDLAITTSGTNASCFGLNDGTADVTATGGLTPYTFIWDGTEITQSISDLPAGNYSVLVQDAQGCAEIGYVTVSEPDELVSYLDPQDISCNGLADGEIYMTVEGGTTPYSIDWSTGDTDYDLFNLGPDLYSVMITDANGCIHNDGVQISEPEILQAAINGMDVLCNGDMSGEAILTVIGGTEPYSFNWSTGDMDENLFGLSAGYYDVTVTDDMGCEVTSDVTLSEPAVIDITSVVTDDDGSTNGAIDITVTGGATPYVFDWSNAEVTEDITGLAAGVYTVIVTDGNGCAEEVSIPVNNSACLLASVAGAVDPGCFGLVDGYAYVTATDFVGTAYYTWSDGQTTDTAFALGAGSYSVTVTDDDGCVDIQYVDLYEPEALTITLDGTPDDGSGIGTAQAIVTGGTSPYSYLWDDGQTTETAVGLYNGTHIVEVTDDNGCMISDSIILYVGIDEASDLFVANIYPNPVSDQLNLDITTGKSGSVKIILINELGEHLMYMNNTITSGDNRITFDMSRYANGLYVVKMISNETIHNYRVVKAPR